MWRCECIVLVHMLTRQIHGRDLAVGDGLGRVQAVDEIEDQAHQRSSAAVSSPTMHVNHLRSAHTSPAKQGASKHFVIPHRKISALPTSQWSHFSNLLSLNSSPFF